MNFFLDFNAMLITFSLTEFLVKDYKSCTSLYGAVWRWMHSSVLRQKCCRAATLKTAMYPPSFPPHCIHPSIHQTERRGFRSEGKTPIPSRWMQFVYFVPYFVS